MPKAAVSLHSTGERRILGRVEFTVKVFEGRLALPRREVKTGHGDQPGAWGH